MTQRGKIQSSQTGTDDNITQPQKDARIQTHTTFYVQPYYIHKESFIVYRQHTKHLIQKLAT
jgi:hypothetical protein